MYSKDFSQKSSYSNIPPLNASNYDMLSELHKGQLGWDNLATTTNRV
jgi:hypothetical protein